MFFTQKIVKKPHFTVAHTVILKSKSIKKFCLSGLGKNFVKVLVLKVKSDFVYDDPKYFYFEFDTASLITANLHRFVNCDFNSNFKNRNFKTSEFA